MRKIAIAGATGNVGREILKILEERNFPCDKIALLASEKSVGVRIPYKNTEIAVENLDTYNFTGTSIGLFSPGGKVSAKYAPIAASQGCVVVDNTSHFRMDEDVPLVVPEVNPDAIIGYKKKGIIANPNCSTIQMVVALKSLHDFAKIKRIVVSTYQSVSGAGKEAMDELYNSTRDIYRYDTPEPVKFSKQIAFNLIPQIDSFIENGNTKEEEKMINETHKILDKNIKVSATCVRVPVFVAHSESINVEFDREISASKAREILSSASGVTLLDDPKNNGFATPVEIAGQDNVFVSRVRQDASQPNSLNLWVVGDNLRKGAALNAVQIAEILVRDYGL